MQPTHNYPFPLRSTLRVNSAGLSRVVGGVGIRPYEMLRKGKAGRCTEFIEVMGADLPTHRKADTHGA